jgi:hypothetical protein
MVPFLKQVADHYYSCGDIQERCFIFPNRRSMVFFKKHLSNAVASSAGRAVLMPKLMTVNEFFAGMADGKVADRVTLLVKLYDCYRKLNPHAESLDEFIFWGDIILGDFNDVDKYLADPKQLFTNVGTHSELLNSSEIYREVYYQQTNGGDYNENA